MTNVYVIFYIILSRWTQRAYFSFLSFVSFFLCDGFWLFTFCGLCFCYSPCNLFDETYIYERLKQKNMLVCSRILCKSSSRLQFRYVCVCVSYLSIRDHKISVHHTHVYLLIFTLTVI